MGTTVVLNPHPDNSSNLPTLSASDACSVFSSCVFWPFRMPCNFSLYSRMNPFSLIIALDERGEASGSLFWDDGDSIGK